MNTEKNLTQTKEITLYFNGKDVEDKLIYAEMKRIRDFGYMLRGVDVSERKLEVQEAERIVRELGKDNPESVLNSEYLESYLVSHVNHFNVFNTAGILLENSSSLKTPIVVKDGVMSYLDCQDDRFYEEIQSECRTTEVAEPERAQPDMWRIVANDFKAWQMAFYFSVILLVFSLLYLYHENPVHTGTDSPNVKIEQTSSAQLIEI